MSEERIVESMETTRKVSGTRRTAKSIRQRIERGGERLWRFNDFADLPSAAVAQTLSRLARQGAIERLSKGIYYHSRATAFGKSRPNPAAIQKLAARRTAIFPSGIAAANFLGFTTQTAGRREVSTSAPSLSRKLFGNDTVIHTRRPAAWSKLSQEGAALLDFLRGRGWASELTSGETIKKLKAMLSGPGHFKDILSAADTEPPRVRAMLGAIGEAIGNDATDLKRIRASLNPLSRFDFGKLAALPNARQWQAKERST